MVIATIYVYSEKARNATHRLVYTHIFSLLYELRGPRSNGIPVAVSTPCVQVLVLIQFPNKSNFGEVADSKTEAGNKQGKPGATLSVRK